MRAERTIHHIDKSLAVLYERVARKFEELENARHLQAREYERRLEELNGKAAQDEKDREKALLQIKDMENKYVAKLHLDDLMKQVNQKLSEYQSFRDQIEGKHSRSNMIAVVALIIVIIDVVLRYSFNH